MTGRNQEVLSGKTMPSMLAYAAPLALLLPVFGQAGGVLPGDGAQLGPEEGPVSTAPDYEQPPSRTERASDILSTFRGGQVSNQVRIEQRVIIRISPRRGANRNPLLARLPQNGLRTRYEEREMESCLAVSSISGVQTGTGNRLLLFTQDQRMISVHLERACRARDFYSGFYVERSEDGQLCVDRDQLQSRSGARCDVERMSQLVAVTE